MDPVFKAWRVTSVVSVLQLLVGLVLYKSFMDISHAAFLVGFLTLAFILPVVEGSFSGCCSRMENVLAIAALTAFAVAAGASVVVLYPQTSGYLGWDFFEITALAFVALLLAIVMLAFVLLAALHYQGMDEVQERPWVTLVCLFPAGIGLVCGGAILLYRQWQKFCELAG
ncbi:MAG: hypothetical protein NUV90_02565 [Candidatus Parcubacteria bacterium]|nr:hypothetical protein [Candidatus Parcubacteria bacterium]